MPLLKKKPFEKVLLPDNLQKHEKVFFCAITNEIFRDYEEFCQRVILCNSMVWTCCLTGKSGLTYSEAIESEQNAQLLLKSFPTELRTPLLYLATKTQRTSFSEMADDIYSFMRDRYFIGENVVASFTGNKWRESHVLQVIGPTPGEVKKVPKNGQFHPPASLYRYEVEQLDAEDKDVSEVMIVDFEHIKRKDSSFSRERSKLFLKQFVKQGSSGIFVIKDSVVQSYGLNKLKFDQYFDGPLPNFPPSKKLIRQAFNGKKTKQDTLVHFLSKTNGTRLSENSVNLIEQMKKKQEEFQIMKQKRADEKLAEKQKRKEENLKVASCLKEWYRLKEDLELDDHKVLPVPIPLKSKVPEKYVGDVLEILEFVRSFSKLLHPKDFFPDGLTLELIERSLTQKEVAGPLMDLIQMFLTALFNVQAEEDVQSAKGDSSAEMKDNINFAEATLYATTASHWSFQHQGMPLSKLPLYSLTTSEILRLHLLSSGCRINEAGSKWRYQHRGGYSSEDDPGLYLRLKQPYILKYLACHSVGEFPIGDKLTIINCLMNQLLTYADVRDIIEDRLEKSRQAKLDIKMLQIAEKKREQEFNSTKIKIKRDCLEQKRDVTNEMNKLVKDSDAKKRQYENSVGALMKQSAEHQTVLGLDRAYRRYVKLNSIPGLFVNCDDFNSGCCLKDPIKQNSTLVGADRTEVIAHIRKIVDEEDGDENHKMNGLQNGHEDVDIPMVELNPDTLLVCNTDPETCVVHSVKINRQKWAFYQDENIITELLDSLNKRGIREGELRQAVEIDQGNLTYIVNNTPSHQLNSELGTIEIEQTTRTTRKSKSKYEDTNLGYPLEMDSNAVHQLALIDNILEIEERIYGGNLGKLKVKDRDAWRENLSNQEFENLDKTLIVRDSTANKIKKESRSSRSNTPDTDTPKPQVNDYNDPGKFLGSGLNMEVEDSETECTSLPVSQPEKIAEAIQTLAIVLIQVAQGVEKRYLKKPLGRMGIKNRAKEKHFDLLEKWESSLMASTSYSQIFLHFSTLDTCILWSRSALLARCQICRRQNDSENMLLCDSCNKGQHLYCLKPKLKSVPKGDWFCKECLRQKAKEIQETEVVEVPVVKKRRIFKEESDEEIQEDENEEEVQEEENCAEEEDDENEVEAEANDEQVENMEVESEAVEEVCSRCSTGGTLLCCDNCPMMYHLECSEPPLRRVPRGKWFCTNCKNKQSKENNSDSDSTADDNKMKRRSNRREVEIWDDLPLHNAPLQELLADVLKQDCAWPFLRPVQKFEVPDYYDIITKPMDFGTIKYKLNMGEYQCDAQLMADAALVFENCNTYNNSDDEVYKCGVLLHKYFTNKCRELGLQLPREVKNFIEDNKKDESCNGTVA